MHVLIVPSEHFVTQRYPVGGIFQLHQANSLHRAGYQVGVMGAGVIPSRYLLRRYLYDRFAQSHGYPVIRRYSRTFYPHRWMKPHAAAGLFRRIGTEAYRSYVRDFGRPDVIHAHNILYAGLIAQAIHAQTGVPYVVTEHSSRYLTGTFSPETAALMATCAGHAGAMTAVSRALASAVEQQLGVKDVGIIPNIVDAYLMDSPLVKRPRSDQTVTFLNVGSLDRNKNQAGLIEAFASRFKGRAATLRLGGTGPEESKLRALVERLGVASQVALLGHLDRPAMLRELRGADCFVLSSHHETFGVVLIEALACGRPVITTRCGGPVDVVTPTSGLIAQSGDTVGLADAMAQMAATLDEYSPSRLREECSMRFGDSAFLGQALNVYRAARGGA